MSETLRDVLKNLQKLMEEYPIQGLRSLKPRWTPSALTLVVEGEKWLTVYPAENGFKVEHRAGPSYLTCTFNSAPHTAKTAHALLEIIINSRSGIHLMA